MYTPLSAKFTNKFYQLTMPKLSIRIHQDANRSLKRIYHHTMRSLVMGARRGHMQECRIHVHSVCIDQTIEPFLDEVPRADGDGRREDVVLFFDHRRTHGARLRTKSEEHLPCDKNIFFTSPGRQAQSAPVQMRSSVEDV